MALINLSSVVRKIQIIKNDITFDVYPWNGAVANPLEEFRFIQDINSITIGGHLIIKDAFNWSGDLNLTGTERIIVELFSDITYQTTKTIEFKIFSIQQISNTGTNVAMNQFEYFNAIKIDFSTDNILSEATEYDLFNLGDDFVGYISTDENSDIPGLINEIFNRFGFEEYEIEPSYNGVWIRSNELTYPWAKNKGQASLDQLLKYITAYTVSKNNKNAINYFLWRDIDGYHFKSVEKMIADSAEITNFYVFTNETTYPFAIKAVYEMSEANILQLSDNNVFQSFYEKISPNYDDYYLDFVDTNLSYKTNIIDFNYHRDFESWSSIETNKILPDSVTTSVYSENGKKISQSLRTDDSVYGYYSNSKLNTPFPQKWDYIGKTADSRWNDVVFIPQYDMTELDIKTFHKIHKKIREPLKAKRTKYSYLKNLKRKWEVYRCSICCLSDRIGGIQDELDIARIRGVTNPQDNSEFKLLFGPTGIFGDLGVNYKIAAAGSFTDVYNYNFEVSTNKGITLSYDLNTAPFNETISDFYHINPDFSNYEKHIFENGFKQYDTEIALMNKKLFMINEFLAGVESFIISANQFQNDNLIDDLYNDYIPSYGPLSYIGIDLKYPEGKRVNYGYEQVVSESGIYNIPSGIFECSKQKINTGSLQKIEESSNFTDPETNEETIKYTSKSFLFNFYNYFDIFTDFNFNPILENPYTISYNEIIQLINDKKAFCIDCLNPLELRIKERILNKEKVVLEQNIKILEYFKNTIKNTFYEKWKEAKNEYLNRKAFFVSKTEEKIKNIDQQIISSNLSLYNIKSIQRKPVRGSRYEILARSRGITGTQVGEYLHKIYFDDEQSDISQTGNHPYYDQSYNLNFGNSSFVSTLEPTRLKSLEDGFKSNDVPLGLFGPDTIPQAKLFVEISNGNASNNNILTDHGFGNRFLEYQNKEFNANFDNYGDKYNIFKNDLRGKKPPSIKREEISSYVRVEFKQPIGVESLSDFPEGFVRNAGYEYFLPYIVSLTAGPNGRQTINQNIVVIGMDPYGFDIAMKRIPDYKQDGEYYWWWSGLESSQMDLWPEVAFETRYPYYTCSPINDNNIDSHYYRSRGLSNSYNIDNVTVNAYYTENAYGNADISYGSLNSLRSQNNFIPNSNYNYNLSNTNNSSGYLQSSNKVTKACRTWWSFHIPSNIIIVPSFKSFYIQNQYFENFDNVFLDNSIHGNYYFYSDYYSYYSNYSNKYLSSYLNDDETYIGKLQEDKNYDFSEILNALDAVDVNFYYDRLNQKESTTVFKDNDTFKQIHPEIKAYFKEVTNWWLSGDHIIYRPGLLSEDVWKYDLSGYTEYGMVFPPVKQNHGDIFDNNFAAQFVVFAKTTDVCTKNDLKCINPNGFVTTSGCTAGNPYCNCPAQNRKPTEAEPSYLEIYKLEQEIKECSLISEHLGEEWLGCVWSNPDNTSSCNCPEVGEKFMDYLEYNRTYATFWNTPAKTPLLRNAQMNLLFSTKLSIKVQANPSLKIGDLIYIVQPNTAPDGENTYRRFTGKYLVTSINYIFNGNAIDYYELTLNRDSSYLNPNEGSEPTVIK